MLVRRKVVKDSQQTKNFYFNLIKSLHKAINFDDGMSSHSSVVYLLIVCISSCASFLKLMEFVCNSYSDFIKRILTHLCLFRYVGIVARCKGDVLNDQRTRMAKEHE